MIYFPKIKHALYIPTYQYFQSIFPIFVILFLNSNNELLDFTTVGRLFHMRTPKDLS